jgi:hypothetical protein
VFAAVHQEVGQLLGVDFAYLGRYEPDRAVTAVSAWPRHPHVRRDRRRFDPRPAVMGTGSRQEQPLPADTEARLATFPELVATAIANAESRTRVSRLAEEQAALRRVATLIAAGAPPEEAFAAVAKEVGRLFLVDVANMCHYESVGTFTIVASAGNRFSVGSRWPLGGKNVSTLVFETGRPAGSTAMPMQPARWLTTSERGASPRRSGRRSSSSVGCGA